MAGSVTLLLLICAAIVAAKDLTVGPTSGGYKAFEDDRSGSFYYPWAKKEKIVLRTDKNTLIHSVVVLDRYEGKTGVAKLVKGGPDHMEVVLEVGSPGPFRGYDFHIEVFTKPSSINPTTVQQQNGGIDAQVIEVAPPASIFEDAKDNPKTDSTPSEVLTIGNVNRNVKR